MGTNGGDQPDTIFTLEEALMRFKRERGEAGAQSMGEGVSDSNFQEVHSSGAVEHETEREKGGKGDQLSGSGRAQLDVSDQGDEANAEMSASDEIVAVIDGIPRTLVELERIAAAEKAYDQDFPETTLQSAEVDEHDAEPAEMDVMALTANRHSLIRDYAFTAMGAALMVLVAILVMHVPIVNDRPTLIAQSIATPALKASSNMNASDVINDAISTLVIVPDADTQQASALPPVKSEQLEARIRGTLKGRAFPDIGVSVSTKGDAYLAGEVYSLDEARKISHIVHSVNGVNRVHFLHPDVRPAGGPAFFGVATASAPAVWGAKVKGVTIGSPADKAGIKAGDVISEFDGNTVPDARYFDLLVTHYSPGQRVQFRVWHDGQPEYLVARLGEVTTVASR